MSLAEMYEHRPLITIFLCVIAIVVDLLIAKCFAEVAEEKNFCEKRYFWIPALLHAGIYAQKVCRKEGRP